jgi:hypothetical protein
MASQVLDGVRHPAFETLHRREEPAAQDVPRRTATYSSRANQHHPLSTTPRKLPCMFQDYSRTTLIAAASAAWLACGSGVASQGVGSAAPALPDASVTNNAAANAQTYNALAATLDAKRSEFLPKSAAEHTAVGNRLFWLEFETFIPKLRSVELRTKATVSYDFSIGVEQSAYVYKASSELIVTVARTSTGLVYRAFDPLATNAKVSEFSTQAPASGERWWAFSVDARTV